MESLSQSLENIKYTLEKDLFINGEFVRGVKNQTINVMNPSTEEKFCEVAEATEEDVDLAVKAAQEGFRLWSEVPLDERSALLNRLACRLEESVREFALVESLDNGKPYGDAVEDIKEVVRVIRFYAGLVETVHGKTLTTVDQMTIQVRRVPYGVVGCISPWNYPLLMSAWKIFPALAAGNSVVLKVSEETPLTTLKLCRLVQELNFPRGVLNVVPGYGAVAGNHLIHHPSVPKVSFTGSPGVGRLIMKASSESNLKNVHLELGGKSPMVVFNDANLDNAVEWIIDGAYRNTSQNCCCGSRLFIQEGVYDEVVKRVVERAKQLKVGRYDEEGVFMGPLINQRQYDRCLGYIKHALEQENLQLLLGGDRPENHSKGYYVNPTIFLNVSDDSKLAREEIFGPVLSIMKPFKTVEEALQRSNHTDYGLASAVFTTDMNKVEYFVRHIQSGTVWVNVYNYTSYNVSFGGMKLSGFGRDNGEEALSEYTTTKAVYYRHDFTKMN